MFIYIYYTTLYSLSPIRTILIKAPLSIIFKEAGTFTKTAITAGKTNGGVAQSVLCTSSSGLSDEKKSLLSGLKCNGFIKIALSGFRPWWHAVHSFCLNCFVFVWILYVNNYEKRNILSTFAFGYTFVIIHIGCRVDLWRYVIFFKLDEEHMHIVEVLGALQL